MSYTLSDLQKDNAFATLQSKAIENLMRLINSTTADFTLLTNFTLNWVNYINIDPVVIDPSGNLLNVLTNANFNGLLDVIQMGKNETIKLNDYTGIYNFQYIGYITALTTSDASYTTILEFLNQLIAL